MLHIAVWINLIIIFEQLLIRLLLIVHLWPWNLRWFWAILGFVTSFFKLGWSRLSNRAMRILELYVLLIKLILIACFITHFSLPLSATVPVSFYSFPLKLLCISPLLVAVWLWLLLQGAIIHLLQLTVEILRSISFTHILRPFLNHLAPRSDHIVLFALMLALGVPSKRKILLFLLILHAHLFGRFGYTAVSFDDERVGGLGLGVGEICILGKSWSLFISI